MGCGSKSSVSRVGTATEESTNSFYYALPKSSIIVTTEVEKKIAKPGVYAKVAPLFGFEKGKICDAAKTTYEVTKTDITTKSYLDEDQVFKYNLSRNFMNKNDFKVEFAPNGEIINSEITNESQIVPLLSSVLSFAGSIYGSVSTLSSTEISGTVTIPVGDLALYNQAKVDFQALLDLKGSYYKALQNDNGATKEIVELKLKKFEEAMNDLTSKFTGVIKKSTHQLVFEIDPKDFTKEVNGLTEIDNTKQTIDLFYFDETKGVKRILTQGFAIPDEDIEDSTVSKSKYTIKLFKINNKDITKIYPDVNQKKTSGAFFYRMPVNAKYLVFTTDIATSKEKNEKTFDISIPQYGLTLAAPDNMKSMNFKLHPTLGSILSANGTTKSIDAAAVEKLGTSASGLLDKFKKEEDPNKKDELIKELERDLKIKQLQEQLNSNSTE